MSFWEAVQFYYPLFGFNARLNNSHPQIGLTVDGINAPIYASWRSSDSSVFRGAIALRLRLIRWDLIARKTA
jgi:hypothetical protein